MSRSWRTVIAGLKLQKVPEKREHQQKKIGQLNVKICKT